MSRATAPRALPILRPVVRRPVVLLAVLAALVVVTLGVRYAGQSSGSGLDARLHPLLISAVTEWEPLALAIDFCGEPAGLATLVVLLCVLSLVLRRPRMAVLVLLGTGLTITATTVVKQFVGRTIHGDFLSYPSGHTASATALAMIAVMLVWHRLRPAAAVALLLGVALVVGAAAAWAQAGLGAHYPTDTIGGWCTALAVVPASAWLVDYVADRSLPFRRSGGTPA